MTLSLRRAFTLVELLVVITIIGILMALLLPAVQMARSSARMATCANNQHQLGIALARYVERNGQAPSCVTMTAGLTEYLEGQSSVYRCPNVENDGDTSYGANLCLDRIMEEPQKIVLIDAAESVLQWEGLNQIEWDAAIAPRHAGSMNVLYYDGRVEKKRPSDINPYDLDTGETTRDTLWRPKRGCSQISGDADCSGGGLLVEYRADTWSFDGPPDIIRVDKTLISPAGEAAQNNVSGNHPFPDNRKSGADENGNGIADCAYTAVWRGKIRADVSDNYRFLVRHDDYVVITLNGTQVLSTPGCCSSGRYSDYFQLNAGQWVPIEIRFDNRWWSHDYLEIRLVGDNAGTVEIPQENLGCP